MVVGKVVCGMFRVLSLSLRVLGGRVWGRGRVGTRHKRVLSLLSASLPSVLLLPRGDGESPVSMPGSGLDGSAGVINLAWYREWLGFRSLDFSCLDYAWHFLMNGWGGTILSDPGGS